MTGMLSQCSDLVTYILSPCPPFKAFYSIERWCIGYTLNKLITIDSFHWIDCSCVMRVCSSPVLNESTRYIYTSYTGNRFLSIIITYKQIGGILFQYFYTSYTGNRFLSIIITYKQIGGILFQYFCQRLWNCEVSSVWYKTNGYKLTVCCSRCNIRS